MSGASLFAYGERWPLLLLAVVVGLLIEWSERRRRRRRAAAFGTGASRVAARLPASWWQRHLVTAAVVTLGVAALGPRFGRTGDTLRPRGVDLVVCLDVSRSMRARDARPDRLERAKADVTAMVRRARAARVGLVLFAGESVLAVPLTEDHEALRGTLGTATPLSVSRGGTDLAAALRTAKTAMSRARGDHSVVVLLTDGEDHGGRGLGVARDLATSGATIHCVGYGTALGAKIPVLNEDDREVFLRDAGGIEVVTSLKGESLAAIAAEGAGRYLEAEAVDDPLVDLLERQILPRARDVVARRDLERVTPRFRWPLVFAGLLLALNFLLSDRRR